MATVGMIVHPERDLSSELARDAAKWLTERGHEVRLPLRDAAVAGVPELGDSDSTFTRGLDVVVSLGGDGTMLRTVDLVAAEGVPVIGVNVGQLGYLTEVEPGGLRMALKRFLAGSYDVEERMLIETRLSTATASSTTTTSAAVTEPTVTGQTGDDEDETSAQRYLALNEMVLEKTPMGHTVRLGVSIDGEFFTPYAADGLIVATPTGSTAYALSARGPIVAPTHRCMLLTPVSPHMLFDRTLVLDPSASVRIEVLSQRAATLSVDGRTLATLQEGDAVVCTAAAVAARLVMFGQRDFLRILKTKFGLSDR